MGTLRVAIFLLGLLVMALALLLAWVPEPPPRLSWQWLFSLGLLLAVAAHGWPDGLR